MGRYEQECISISAVNHLICDQCTDMSLPVVSQVVLPPEGLVTDVTSVRPFVCVRALVDQQVVGLSEVAATELAHKLLFRLGWESSTARFSFWRGELGHI